MSEVERNDELEETQTMTIEDENEKEDEDDSIPEQFNISVENANYNIQTLVSLYQGKEIYIPPFQRGYVWTRKQASRLIESILLGLPVPPLFLAIEKDKRMIVIDGQQRLRSIVGFYEGQIENKKFKLYGVIEKYNNLTYEKLESEDQRKFKYSNLPVIIIDPKEEKDRECIYYIFERLNTGGTNLKPQEIRACIYHGELNDLIEVLNENEEWRKIFYSGKNKQGIYGQEMILRFFARYYDSNKYTGGKIIRFLNKWMAENRNPGEEKINKMENIFTSTIKVIYDALSENAFKKENKFITAFFESIMVAVAERLEERGEIKNLDGLREKYYELVTNPEYLSISVKVHSSAEMVKKRIEMAREAFKDIE